MATLASLEKRVERAEHAVAALRKLRDNPAAILSDKEWKALAAFGPRGTVGLLLSRKTITKKRKV